MLVGRITKESTDTGRYVIDFGTEFLDDGETLTSFTTPSVTLLPVVINSPFPFVSPPVSQNPVYPSDPTPLFVAKSYFLPGFQQVQLMLQAGTPGNTYCVVFVASGSSGRGQTVELIVSIPIAASSADVVNGGTLPTPPAGTYVTLAQVGVAGGVAPLDINGKVPAANLPPSGGGFSIAVNMAAAATPTPLASQYNHFSTVTSNTSAILLVGSALVYVFNDGAITLPVLPPAGAQIAALGNNTPVGLEPGQFGIFVERSSTQWSVFG